MWERLAIAGVFILVVAVVGMWSYSMGHIDEINNPTPDDDDNENIKFV